MKLDATVFRYMTKDEFRVLTAVEMGMRNHELVPVPLIESIAKITRGGTFKIIQNLLKHKLVAHETKAYDGYRLTYKGFDFLALRALCIRGSITGVGRRIGVGKESDVHACQGPNGETFALKLHRLGRISFRAVKSKRDYMQHRQHGSWMYMARLAALKEFAYMKALYDEDFPVPTPVDQNRHCVVMSMIDATCMYNIRDMPRPQSVLEKLFRLLIRLGRAGIVHGDFNEFNLLIGKDLAVTLIDFPQIIHLTHPNAEEYFDRDVKSVCQWFKKKCDIEVLQRPSFKDILAEVEADNGTVLAGLNAKLKASGVSKDDDNLLVAAHGAASDPIAEQPEAGGEDDDDEDEEDDDEEAAEAAEEPADGHFSGLVPEGGRRELGEADDEACEAEDGSEAAAGERGLLRIYPDEAAESGGYSAAAAPAPPTTGGIRRQWRQDAANEESDSDESGEEESDAEERAPGEVSIPKSTKKTRKVTSAKDARKNLQKQQKTKPAKANNMKTKELRNAKHNIKEMMM